MSMTSLTLVAGDTAFVDWRNVVYIKYDVLNPTRCWVGLLSSDPRESPLYVEQEFGDVVNSLHAAAGTTPVNSPYLVALQGSDEPVPFAINANLVASVTPDYVDPGKCYLATSDGSGPWHVWADPSSIAGGVAMFVTAWTSHSMLSGFFATLADGEDVLPISFVNTGVQSFVATRGGFLQGMSASTNFNVDGVDALVRFRVSVNGLVNFDELLSFGQGDGVAGRRTNFGGPIPFAAGDRIGVVYSSENLTNTPAVQVALECSYP